MKRIGIDARMYGSSFLEIGVYTKHLLQELAKLAPEGITFVVFGEETSRLEIEALGNNFEFIPIHAPIHSFSEQVLFPHILRKAQLDLIHFLSLNVPLLYRGKCIVTIHDLVPCFYPKKSMNSWMEDFIYRLSLKSIVSRAHSIITISHHTKKDLIELMQIDDKHIFPIAHGVNTPFGEEIGDGEIAEMRRSLQISENRYILYVGVLQNHKNIVRLLQAFGMMIQAGFEWNLILAGKEDTKYTEPRDTIRELGLQSRVQFIWHVEVSHHIPLLKWASLFIMPSLYEGFNMPIIEAMKAGIPVICSDSSSLPEIGGNAVRYFHPLRPETLAKVAIEILGSRKIQMEMTHFGIARANEFNWENTAKATLAVYQKTLEK